MMGSGKSTLGKRIATWYGQPFVDTDELIEQRFGKTCSELVAAGNFATQQKEVILDYSPHEPEVVATGGSVAKFPELVEHLAQFGVGIFVYVDRLELDTRLSEERKNALLSSGRSFEEEYAARLPKYVEAANGLVLPVGVGETEQETVGFLVALRNSVNNTHRPRSVDGFDTIVDHLYQFGESSPIARAALWQLIDAVEINQ